MAFKQSANNIRVPFIYAVRYCCRLKLLFIILFPLFLNLSWGNKTIEELKKKLNHAPDTDVELRINLLNDLAWEYTYQDLDTAYFFGLQGLELALEHKSEFPGPLSNSYGTIGIIFDLQGNNNQALTYYLESLELKTTLNDSSGIANMKTNIGALFFTQEDYAKALPYFNEALAIETALKDSLSQIGSLINIGVIHKNQGHLEISKRYLFQALSINQSLSNIYYYGMIYNNIGANYLQGNQNDSALFYFEKGALENLAADNIYNFGISLENQAKIYLKKGELNLARKKANEALHVGQENGYYFLLTNSFETLYEIHLATGNIDSAFYYKELFTTFKDSILSKENKQIVDEIEAKYKLEKKQSELFKKDAQIAQNEKQSTIFKIILITAFFGAILLVWVIVSKVKNNRVLSTKNQIIQEALDEKEVLMREIHHRVKNNIQAIKSIINIQKRKSNSNETKESLNQTLNRVNAMALIHNKLYQQNSLFEIGSDDYFEELIEDVFQSFGISEENSQVDIQLCSHVFETDHLLTLGLVINELITNSCKYGKSETGKLSLVVHSEIRDKSFIMRIKDEGIASENIEKGFGTDLIDAMIFKLKGKITYIRDDGYLTEMIIPIED